MPRTALGPIIGLSLVVLFILASVFTAQAATSGGVGDGSSGSTSTRFVSVETRYNVDPGDRVEVYMPTVNNFKRDAEGHFRLLVVEGGEGGAYKTGGTAAHVLKDFVWHPFTVRFERPGIYAGKPHAEGLNGDYHNAIDLVFLYEKPASMSASTYATSQSAVSQMVEQHEVVIADGTLVDLQWLWFVGIGGAAAWTVVSTLVWLRTRTARPDTTDDLEALVVMQSQAQRYLRLLRDTMRVAGAVLMLGGIGCLVALNAMMENVRYDPATDWTIWMMLLGTLTLAAAVAVWAVQYRRISREVQRWEATPSPLDA